VWLEGLRKLKKFNDLIEIQTCNLAGYNIVPQPVVLRKYWKEGEI
jgi:hypothetical protein